MNTSQEFCPRCGDAVPERPEPLPGEPSDRDERLCDACYFDQFGLVDAPDRIEVRVCATCGAVHRGNRWVDVGARDYTDVAIEEVSESLGVHVDATDVSWSVEPEQVDQNTIRMHCRFQGLVRGTLLEEEVVVPVRIARETCTRCGRIAGGYHNSILQIRAVDRTPTQQEQSQAIEIAEEYVAERADEGDRDAFVTEIDETADGVDVKISTTQMGQGIANRIVDRLGGSVEHHPTLVTEDEDGNEVYRVTHAVRLPAYTAGDVIDPEDDDGPVLVRSVQGNLKGVRLATGDRYEASFEEGATPDARRLGSVDDAVETTVVTVEDDRAVQVLDPETYEAKTIPRPEYMDPGAGSVPVLKSRAGLHVVPTEAIEQDEVATGRES